MKSLQNQLRGVLETNDVNVERHADTIEITGLKHKLHIIIELQADEAPITKKFVTPGLNSDLVFRLTEIIIKLRK